MSSIDFIRKLQTANEISLNNLSDTIARLDNDCLSTERWNRDQFIRLEEENRRRHLENQNLNDLIQRMVKHYGPLPHQN